MDQDTAGQGAQITAGAGSSTGSSTNGGATGSTSAGPTLKVVDTTSTTASPFDSTVVGFANPPGDKGTTLVKLSNGQAFQYAGLLPINGAWRVQLRDGSGAATIVGPIFDSVVMAEFKSWCAYIGAAWLTEWDSPPGPGITLTPPAATPGVLASTSTGAIAKASPASATPAAPVSVAAAKTSRLRELADALERDLGKGAHWALGELHALAHAL